MPRKVGKSGSAGGPRKGPASAGTSPAASPTLRTDLWGAAGETPAAYPAFWPYGLNQSSEATSADDYVFNCKMVGALPTDVGL